MKLQLPVLSRISRNFSDESANLNQQITTRIRGIPTVSNYTPGTPFAAAAVTDTDVPLTITNSIYTQIAYNQNELASTNRDLFAEQSEGAAYSIGLALTNAIYALINTTNFSAGSQKTVQAVGGFGVPTVKTIGKALSVRGCDIPGRLLVLNPDYHQQLGEDARLLQLGAYQNPSIITEDQLGRVAGF